jgi:hypothetical protein
MKRIYWVFLIFIAASASFSQYIEKADDANFQTRYIEKADSSNFQLKYSVDETEESAAKTLYENQRKYYSARNKFRLGLIMGGISAVAFIGSFSGHGSSLVQNSIVFGTPFAISIPFTIVGAVNMHKYWKYRAE